MKKYFKVRIVEGSLMDKEYIKKFSNKILEDLGDPNWGNLIEVVLDLDEIKEVQKTMTRHHQDSVPWYMDGFELKNPDNLICAFGVDDGEGGRIFVFDKNSKEVYSEVINYGMSKGIPRKQLDFND